jgi:hypothetical protein
MIVKRKEENMALLELNYDDVYVLLQCVAEMENRTVADIEAITGFPKIRIVQLADELNEIKKAIVIKR